MGNGPPTTSAVILNNQIKTQFTTTYEIYKKFLTWRKENNEIRTSGAEIYPAALTFLRQNYPHIRASSTRTYYNNILSSEASARGAALPKTPLAKNLKRHLDREVTRETPTRAPILTIEELTASIKTTLHRMIITVGLLVCARIDNLHGFFVTDVRERRSHEFLWMSPPPTTIVTVRWWDHKTSGAIGQRDTTFPLPLQIASPEMISTLKKWTKGFAAPTAQLQSELPANRRSLRRSGARFWEAQGAPLDWLCTVTLHTSIQSLQTYLSQ